MKNMFKTLSNSKLFVAISLTLLLIVYILLFDDFFPNQQNKLGHDYTYFLSRLLAGYYWFETNGLFAIPWFTPAFCGSTVFFAHPQDLYFSVPQLLTFFIGPLKSIWFTFVLFAAIGLIGFYFLLRKVFLCTIWSSLLGGTLFLFNGFYTYRIIIGHLTFHGFMLLPLIVLFLLWHKKDFTIRQEITFSIIAAILFSYIFYAGGVHLLIPTMLAILSIACIYLMLNKQAKYLLLRLSIFAVLVILLSLTKLTVGLATLDTLTRDAYPLPGIPNFFDSFWVPIKSLFINVLPWDETKDIFTNIRWHLDQHELEFGITFIPLLFLLIGLRYLWILKGRQWIYLAMVFFILLIPIGVNFYTPEWNHFLKQIPIIKNSSTLVRWYLIYIPVFILIAAIVFDRLQINTTIKASNTLILIVLIIMINIDKDKTFYQLQNYDPTPIQTAYFKAKQNNKIPEIRYVAANVTNLSLRGDDLMTVGVSQIHCYESLFGYRHEFFPQKGKLFAGLVTDTKDGVFNMKNPACYTFPTENACKAGDHFKLEQKAALERFTHYLPYRFNLSSLQKITNIISLVSWILVIMLLLFHFIQFILIRYKKTK